MTAFQLNDVEALVRLVARVGDPTAEHSLVERKRMLLEGVAELIEADVWLWSVTAHNDAVAGDMATQGLIDGGWRDSAERVALARFLTEPETAIPVQAPIARLARLGSPVTVHREEFVPDDVWQRVGEMYYASGLRHFLLSIYPLSEDQFSAVGFHRRAERPPFSERDRGLVHVIFQQVDWLHRQGENLPVGSSVLTLTARERQVLIFLLDGDTRKEIALKLQLSEHTVGDYMKNIYRQLQVRTRGELLSLFISGGRTL